jgi:hypothetical protein
LHFLGAADESGGVGAATILGVRAEALAEWPAQRWGRREHDDGKRRGQDMDAGAQHLDFLLCNRSIISRSAGPTSSSQETLTPQRGMLGLEAEMV